MEQAYSIDAEVQQLVDLQHSHFIRTQTLLFIVCLVVAVFVLSLLRRDRRQLITALQDAKEESDSRQLAEEEIKKSSERFSSFMQQTDEGFFLFETDQAIPTDLAVEEQIRRLYTAKVIECNHAQARMYGFSDAKELVGTSLAELHGGTDIPKNIAFLKSCIENGYRINGAISSEVDREGNTVWFSNNIIGVVENNALVRIWGTQTNVTKRKQAEEALKRSEIKFRTFYEKAPIPYHSLDYEGRFLDINPAWLRLLGYEREEVIGHNYADFLHPDWLAPFKENFPAFRTRGYIFDIHFKLRHKDGHYIDISLEGCIGYHPDGSFQQTYCVFQDITELRKTEAALVKSEAQARLMADMVMTSDQPVAAGFANGQLVRFNPAFCNLTGYSERELHAIGWSHALTPPEWLDAEREILAELKRSDQPVRYEKEYLRKDGSRVPVELFVHKSHNTSHQDDYYYAFISDITERKRKAKSIARHREILEREVQKRTIDLEKTIDLMADREIRMRELKQENAKLRAQSTADRSEEQNA
jgi:PAS domain S-box-containing protein